MSKQEGQRVLIIGAGCMGIILGYYLSLAEADVTFLVRPHRIEQLSRPQTLYCYNDNQLKTFSDFKLTTSPAEMIGAGYDYIVITLDAANLRNEIGQHLVKTIGEAVRGTKTGVVVGAVLPDLKSWFLETSGLSSEQVIIGTLYVQIYPVKVLELPASSSVDTDLLTKADYAYTDSLGPGLILEDDAPAVANGLANLYNANKVSRCDLITPAQNALVTFPFFAVFAACELMEWPKFRDIAQQRQLWSLAVAALKEIQALSVNGEAGRNAAQNTTEDGFAQVLKGMEDAMLPFELQTFNHYHHGGKVNVQDRQILGACLASGVAEGAPMTALKELLQRVESH